jgi:hypothetical protein
MRLVPQGHLLRSDIKLREVRLWDGQSHRCPPIRADIHESSARFQRFRGDYYNKREDSMGYANQRAQARRHGTTATHRHWILCSTARPLKNGLMVKH